MVSVRVVQIPHRPKSAQAEVYNPFVGQHVRGVVEWPNLPLNKKKEIRAQLTQLLLGLYEPHERVEPFAFALSATRKV